MTGKNDGIRLEILANDSVAGIGSLADIHPSQDDAWVDIFASSNTSFPGGDEASDQMASLSAEEDILGSLDSSSPPDEFEEHGFSLTFESAQKAKKGVIPPEFLDFDDSTMQWAALSIYEAVQQLYRTIHDPDASAEVAAWLFCDPIQRSEHEVTFEDCCNVHNARPDVVRMRIMYELWRFDRHANAPFEFVFYRVPEFISTSLYLDMGPHAQRLAQLLWRCKRPGNSS